jgi:lantibiotic modifying enzyme
MPERGHLSRRDLLRLATGAAGLLTVPASLRAGSVHWAPPASGSGTGGRQDRSPGADIEVALRIERWIRTTRIRTAAGVAWPADPDQTAAVSHDLYSGTPGVILFLLELHAATGDDRFLDEAIRGADDLAANLASPGEFDGGLYSGVAGRAFTLAETWRATGVSRYRDAAAHGVTLIRQNAREAGAGIEWSETTDIISGSAGILLFLLYAARTLGEDSAAEAVALAGSAGRRLVELGSPADGGLKWAMSPRVAALYPNFSHGTAGVSYALTTLYGVTAEKALLDAALAGAAYLDAVGVAHDGGCRVFHHEPDGRELFYLSWCHGAPGTARLFERLRQVNGDARWADRVACHARGVTHMGAPVGRSAGYWNNISQCCGNAGVGDFFLSLHRQWPDRGYLDVARGAADDILERATEAGGGLKWIQAEHRVRPELLVAQTGRMQGAAGVGSFFLHLDAWVQGRELRMTMPDSPWA